MARTKDETLREVTRKYLAGINPKNPPSPDTIQGEILDETRVQFELTNGLIIFGHRSFTLYDMDLDTGLIRCRR